MRKIPINVYDIASWLYHELSQNDIQFNYEGYPVFKPEFILWQKPKYILPFNHRNAAPVKSETALCFYMNDKLLYKRLSNLKNDLSLFSGYLGICGFDLSPRMGWDEDLQKFNILLSQMATIWLALHGIRIIPNFRTGSFTTFSSLNAYYKNMPVAIGALGCWKKKLSLNDLLYFKLKIFQCNPQFILIYGMIEDELIEMIEESGIEYQVYPDFRSTCRRREVQNVRC
ncbi:MAG: DUF4417 domain-containing protein [Treponema sp.]|nr:DUF4417 domain-containing protein [Treponema sp.]